MTTTIKLPILLGTEYSSVTLVVNHMERRGFLAYTTLSVLCGLSGCSGIASDSPSDTSPKSRESPNQWQIRPDGDPMTVPQELTCSDDAFTRHWTIPEDRQITWGSVEQLTLRINELSVNYGDTVRINLTNTAPESVETGNRRKFVVELYTAAGWQPVRGTTRETQIVYADDAVSHQPDDGFSWELRLTETGLAHAGKDLKVCPDLVTGRYRFVYWGLTNIDAAVAVAFDLYKNS